MNRTNRVVNNSLKVRNEDILVSWSASLDAYIWSGEEAWLNQHIFRVIPGERISNPRYLYYLLKHEIGMLKRSEHLHGSTMMHINRGPFLAHSVPLPPEDVQHDLVSHLDATMSEIDDGETALAQARADLEVYRRSLLKAAVTGELTADWRAANPPKETGADLLARILAERRARWEADLSNNGRRYEEPASTDLTPRRVLPRSWTWASLDQLSSEMDKSFQSGPFGSALLHSEFQSEGKLVIGIDNVRDGHFSLGSQHRISNSKFEALKRFQVRPLDILVTVMATIGRACVVPVDIEDAIVTKHVYRVSINHHACDPGYVLHCLRGCASTVSYLYSNTRGQTRAGLNKSILQRTPIPIMPLEEQAECNRILRQAFQEATDLDQMLTLLGGSGSLRQSILAAAFRGELL